MIAHFYHVWADGDWAEPAAEHAAAMTASSLRPGVTAVGLIGSPARRRQARLRFSTWPGPVRFIEADSGFEQVTLRALHAWALVADPDTPVLYAHTKGAYHVSPVTAAHRKFMTAGVVGRWHDAVAALADHQVAGCFWDVPAVPYQHFTGNFWWARAGYLAGLPPVPDDDRFAAERWLGMGAPSAFELAEFTYREMVEAIVGRPEPELRGTVMPPGTQRMVFL